LSGDDLNSGQAMTDFVIKVFLARDSDGDGIYDQFDECPNTPRAAPVNEKGCWIIGDVLFDFNKHNIKPEGRPVLDEIADVLNQNPDLKIRIAGHTDIIGIEHYNDALSIRRARSGKAYLGKEWDRSQEDLHYRLWISQTRVPKRHGRRKDKKSKDRI
jgi:OOP family OmpA-OmpF porin